MRIKTLIKCVECGKQFEPEKYTVLVRPGEGLCSEPCESAYYRKHHR